ncbi:MAG TPA: hypothetical protein VGI81_04795 [Tepidisphaeraceae bacterium]
MPAEEPSDITDAPRMAAGSCIACGYDLRGLAEDSACPECGRAIIESRQFATLRNAGTAWLFTLVRWAAVMAVIESVSACRGAILLYNSLCLRVLQRLPTVPTRVWSVPLYLVIVIANLIATWRVTAPPPAESDDESQRSIRMWLRFVTVATATVAVLMHTVGVLSAELARVWEIALNLLAAAGAWLFWSYIGRLSARIPSESLVRRSRSVRWGEVLGILAGPTLSWIIYRNTTLSYGFRLFGSLPGRFLLLAYTVIAPFVLLSFTARVRRLADEPQSRLS